MKIIKGRRGKSRVVDEYIKSYLDQGKKVVMFDTVGVKAIAHEGRFVHLLFNHPFRTLVSNFNSSQFEGMIQDADLIVFYANTDESIIELIKEYPFESRSLVTIQSDSKIELIEV